jgi:hypothetical protein
MNHDLKLTTEELLMIAHDIQCNLQNAIDNNISKRVSFYKTIQNKIQTSLHGPVAQRLEQSTHNALVAGSNPAGSTT